MLARLLPKISDQSAAAQLLDSVGGDSQGGSPNMRGVGEGSETQANVPGRGGDIPSRGLSEEPQTGSA